MKQAKVRAFTRPDGTGGNAAGVVLLDGPMQTAEKQRLANELAYSETAFHRKLANGIDSLEFFTPNKQIAMCGHATVATFGVLARDRRDGTFPVQISDQMYDVKLEGDKVGLQQKLAFVRPVTDFKVLLMNCFIDLDIEEIVDTAWVNNGVDFFIIQIRSWPALKKLKPNQAEIERISKDYGLIGFYLFTEAEGSEFYTRMFAPFYGIAEESATGMGAGGLMAFLKKKKNLSRAKILQGQAMTPPQPSLIEAEIKAHEIWVYGRYMIEGSIS